MPSNENQPKLTKREIDMIKRAFDFNDQHRGENERWWEHKKKILESEREKQNPYLYDAVEHSHKGKVEDPEHDGRLKENKEKKEQEEQRQAYLSKLKERITQTAIETRPGFDPSGKGNFSMPPGAKIPGRDKPAGGMTTVTPAGYGKPAPAKMTTTTPEGWSAKPKQVSNPLTTPAVPQKAMPNYNGGPQLAGGGETAPNFPQFELQEKQKQQLNRQQVKQQIDRMQNGNPAVSSTPLAKKQHEQQMKQNPGYAQMYGQEKGFDPVHQQRVMDRMKQNEQNNMRAPAGNRKAASLQELQKLRKSINVAISKAASIEERNELHAKLASVSADLIRMGALNKDNG
jgi:hypothetical protein